MTRAKSHLLVSVLLLLALVPATAFGAEPDGDGVRTVYLIRHGDYDHDDERDPDVGKGLVPLGVAQARLVAHRLRSMPVEWSSLHASTMTRARETALVMAAELPQLDLQTSRQLRECTPPTWREDIMAEETAADLAACQSQLESAFATYFTPSPEQDRHDILVCHGNVIRYFVTKVLKIDPLAWLGMSIGNCSLTVVKILPDGSMKLLSFSDVGHIPPGLQTHTSPGGPLDLSVPQPPGPNQVGQP